MRQLYENSPNLSTEYLESSYYIDEMRSNRGEPRFVQVLSAEISTGGCACIFSLFLLVSPCHDQRIFTFSKTQNKYSPPY